ncbi:MAG: hypothetical protein H5T63_03920 [Chloroflexi bacterium]|nr:hypothetical protein [Chloroflexota bacterium]
MIAVAVAWPAARLNSTVSQPFENSNMNDSNNAPVETDEQQSVNSGESKTIVGQEPAPLFSPGFTFGELSWRLALGVPVLCMLMALIEGSSYIWRPVAIALYVILLLLGISAIAVVLIAVDDASDTSDTSSKYGTEAEFALALLGSIAVLVAFSQVSRHLYLIVGGFIADQSGYWHWLRFGFSNLLESILFDIPAIYDWGISEIRATSTWSRTVVFVFRTTIEFLVVAGILRQARIAWKTRHRAPKSPPNNYFALILPKVGNLILIALWGLPIAIGIGAVVNDGLSLESTWSVIKLGTPVAFGIWLAWHSLRGLGMPGLWNKLFAMAGIIGGIWLLRNYWPAFRMFLGQ